MIKHTNRKVCFVLSMRLLIKPRSKLWCQKLPQYKEVIITVLLIYSLNNGFKI